MPRTIPFHLLLALQFALQTVGLAGLVGYLSYRSGQDDIEVLAQQLMEETGDRVTQELNSHLQAAHRLNQTHIAALESGAIRLDNLESLHRYLILQHRAHPEITSLLLGTPRGDFRSVHRVTPEDFAAGITNLKSSDLPIEVGRSNPDNPSQLRLYAIDAEGNLVRQLSTEAPLDVRDRPWYQLAVKTGQPGWTEPFQIGATNLLAINAYAPFYDAEQQLQAVISVNLSLQHLNQFLETLNVGETGEVFVLDRKGLLVANSAGEPAYIARNTRPQPANDESTLGRTSGWQFQRLPALESSEPLIRQATQHLQAQFADLKQLQTERELDFNLDRQRHFLRVLPYRDRYGLDWLVVTIIPKADFTDAIRANVRRTLALCGLALLGTIGSSLWIARRLTRSLAHFSEATQAVAAGQLDLPLQRFSRIREVANLIQSFQQMLVKLREAEQLRLNYQQTLEQQVAEKTAAFEEAQSIAHVGSWEFDLEAQTVTWSAELYRIYEADETAPVPRPDLTIQQIHPEDWERFQELVPSAIAAGQSFDFDTRIITQAGNIRYIQAKGRPIFNAEGNAVKFVGTVADITERKLANIALQKSEHRFQEIGRLACQHLRHCLPRRSVFLF